MNDTDKQEKSEEAAWNSNIQNSYSVAEQHLLRLKRCIFWKCIEHQKGKERKQLPTFLENNR